MKGVSILVLLVLLSGCMYYGNEIHVTREHVEKYLNACSNNGGVKSLVVATHDARHSSHVIDRVICNDGAVFDSTVVNRMNSMI